ncbi:MAG: hypothetical protein KGH94_03680 [Candidatus Micrarchaeota archaeon]|nr:hypothetical protein [Candidatus Micrarchaeota archaeon]
MRTNYNPKGQSSLELLITVSFALIILLPIVILAFVQMSSTSSNLATGEAQAAATKLAEVAVTVGAQGPPAKQLILIDMPSDVQQIIIGNQVNSGTGFGHQIIFIVDTNAGLSDAVAYVPVNVTGNLGSVLSQGTYLVNVSAESPCTYAGSTLPCVVITPT